MLRLIIALSLSLVLAILLAHGVAFLDEMPDAGAASTDNIVIAR